MEHQLDKMLLAIVILSIVLAFGIDGQTRITGFGAADVGINSRTQGSLTLDYDTNVNLTEIQNISAEFSNTGSQNYSARISLTIYMYNATTGNLEQLATYYDSSVILNPGERRSFDAVFLPMRIGTYYIKAKVEYGTRVSEAWGSFFVTYYVAPEQEIIYVVTSYGGGTIPAQRESGVTDLALDYNDTVRLYPGQKELLTVRLNNTGTINLHNLKFYSSTTEYIGFEVNPKEIYELGFGESNIYLVSLETSNDIPPGEYDFFFEILGLEVKRSGSITINVVSEIKSIKDEVYDIILNYQYLIADVDHEIYTTSAKGFNTSRAEVYMDDAKAKLQEARGLYDQGRYEEARDALDIVKRDLENVVFELAAISFAIYAYPAFSPYLILLLIIIIAITTIIFLYLYRKRKNRKPRLIKAFTEEEES